MAHIAIMIPPIDDQRLIPTQIPWPSYEPAD
jgi:hypothetical protein